MSQSDLDGDTPGPPVGSGLLDLRVGVEHASVRVDGELQLPGSTVPLRRPRPIGRLSPDGRAPVCDGALELTVGA